MDEDDLMMTALDAGAEDFAAEEDSYEIVTDPDDFSKVRESLLLRMISRICRRRWICWKKTMTSRMSGITGTNRLYRPNRDPSSCIYAMMKGLFMI